MNVKKEGFFGEFDCVDLPSKLPAVSAEILQRLDYGLKCCTVAGAEHMQSQHKGYTGDPPRDICRVLTVSLLNFN